MEEDAKREAPNEKKKEVRGTDVFIRRKRDSS